MKKKWTKILFILLVVFFALFCNLQAAEPLPDTGQTKFYNNSVEISKPALGEAFDGQDAHYTRERSYTKLGANGVDLPISATTWYQVRDNVTGLIWEVKTFLDGTIHDRDNKYDWNNAQNVFIATLNAGSGYCSHTDWRLPTIKELSFIVDSGSSRPCIDIEYFTYNALTDYWSSTSGALYSGYTTHAWVVSFSSGSTGRLHKSHGRYTRAVRSGQ